jgi:hypothetical protein
MADPTTILWPPELGEPLSLDHRAQLEREGYVVLRGVIAAERLAAAQRDAAHPPPRSALGERALRSLSTQDLLDPRGRPGLLELVQLAAGAVGHVLGTCELSSMVRIVGWPSGAPGVGLHVDMIPDPTVPWPAMDLSVSLPLTAASSAEEGAFYVCSGRHHALLEHVRRQPCPEHAVWQLVAGNRRLFKQELPFELSPPTVVPLAPGDLLLMNPALPHGVHANRSSRDRTTLIVNFELPERHARERLGLPRAA